MKKLLNVEIGVRVRQSREQMNLSRERLAELVGISKLFLGYIECGQKGMSLETLITICKALHVSADYIFMGKEQNHSDSCIASRLLEDIPEDYIPLADDHMRLLVKTIRSCSKAGPVNIFAQIRNAAWSAPLLPRPAGH